MWVSTSVDNLNEHLNGVCPDYMLELLRRNIGMRATERQSRYGYGIKSSSSLEKEVFIEVFFEVL